MSDPNSSSSRFPIRKRVVLLGATGSIGQSALRVIASHKDRIVLAGIAAHSNWRKLAEIAREYSVRDAAIYDEASFIEAKKSGAFPMGTRLLKGSEGLSELAVLPAADIVLVAVVGTAGLEPALAAIEAGKDLALASKEILVLAGKFVMEAAKRKGTRVLPVDSEHNAVFQCLEGHPGAGIKRVVLTASGGAFRDWPVESLEHATPADALKHPNWDMGKKVTVDSATLANKGLELIEAQWLFGLRPEQCAAVIHPQSLVHCLVEFNDGAMLAQLAPTSMTFPIQHALLYPERAVGVEPPIDFTQLLRLDFRPVDENRFPMIRYATQSMHAGGVAPAVFNAANEVAVAAFLGMRIPFLAIPKIVGNALERTPNFEPGTLGEVLAVDMEARRSAEADVEIFK
ncbi:MAG: 1-deoxy-D-xylulose-5-phosphate reductoisomerase [Opitutaceae bacterium]